MFSVCGISLLCATLGRGALPLYGVATAAGVVFLVVLSASLCARVYLLVHDWTCFVNGIYLRKVVGFFPQLGFSQDKSRVLLSLVYASIAQYMIYKLMLKK
jgi:hypothetical protein